MSSDPGGSFAEPLSRDLFRRACGRFTTGVAVAGVIDPSGQPHALTVNSFTSVSLEPPLILICLAHSVAAIDVFRAASRFGLSFLSSSQIDISERFAHFAEDRFEGIPWHPGPGGVPLIDGAVGTLECSVVRWFPLGDHDVFVGEVMFAEVLPGEPLAFFAGDYRRLS